MGKHNSSTRVAKHNSSSQPGQTGLLTKFVPDRLKHGSLYRWWLRFTRVLQFLSAVISLGLFSSRLYKVYRLVNRVRDQRGVDGSFGAVEGILAAAVLYTLLGLLLTCLLRGGGPTWLRWLWVILDILFVGAFIAVAVLTRPNGGPAGPRRCYDKPTEIVTSTTPTNNEDDPSCQIPWGVFILAIVSTILHAITAAFNEVKDHHHNRHAYDHENGRV